jgi:hypothetical protein
MNWTHPALITDLAAHLRGNTDRLVWEDMQLGPSGSARPDLFTLDKSYTHFRPLAYEVKVSVSDFRRDVTTGKWQRYLKFACGVYFAVPAGLIHKGDIPDGCGLMVRNESGWRSVRKPTLKHMDTLPRDLWVKLLIDGCARAATTIRDRGAAHWKANQEINRKFGARTAEAPSDRDSAATRLEMERDRHLLELEAMRERHRKEREKLLEEFRKENNIVDLARAELAEALGLKPNASVWHIRQAAQEAADRLNANKEVLRLRMQLDSIKQALNQADEPVAIASIRTGGVT